MNSSITIPDRPSSRPAEIQEDLRSLVEQLGDGATAAISASVTLDSGVNKIRHGLAHAPKTVSFSPHTNVAWWVPTLPDGQFVYIETAGAVTGDLVVWA